MKDFCCEDYQISVDSCEDDITWNFCPWCSKRIKPWCNICDKPIHRGGAVNYKLDITCHVTCGKKQGLIDD